MRRLLFALVVCGIAAQSAQADVSYQYVSDQSSYSVAQGGSVTVNLYLAETVTPSTAGGNSNSSLIWNDGGLTGAGIYAKVANGSTATITGLAANVVTGGGHDFTNFDTKENAQFNATQAAILMGNFGVNTTGNIQDGNSVSSTTTNKVLLGTLTITAGASASGTTTFSLLSYANAPSAVGGFGGNNNTTTAGELGSGIGAGLDLDVTNNNALGGPPPLYTGAGDASQLFQFTVNVSPVPEPSSFLLCGFAACGMGYGAWRRRKAARMAAAEANTPALGA